MAPKKDGVSKRVVNKGVWTVEEDRKLAEYIEIHGAKRWKATAVKAGLNRCGKICRLRWLNYLRPNIIVRDLTGRVGVRRRARGRSETRRLESECWQSQSHA